MDTKKQNPGEGRGFVEKEVVSGDTALVPSPAPAVNLDSPRLWSAFRRYARNQRRIARLVAENEGLLDRLRQIQGVAL